MALELWTGVPSHEIDQWGEARQAHYRRGGASIAASNDSLHSDI